MRLLVSVFEKSFSREFNVAPGLCPSSSSRGEIFGLEPDLAPDGLLGGVRVLPTVRLMLPPEPTEASIFGKSGDGDWVMLGVGLFTSAIS